MLRNGLIGALQEARHVCVLTGAGISAESGVPTFRDAQTGLWAKFDPHELATQNIDGLHQRAGSPDVIEFHGNIFEDRCFVENRIVECDDGGDTPRCPACGGHVRPGVVWFGESIPEQALNESFAAAADCDVFLSIGTSSLVFPAAGLAEIAGNTDAVVAEVNPNPTQMSSNFHFAVAGNAGMVLPELVDCLKAS